MSLTDNNCNLVYFTTTFIAFNERRMHVLKLAAKLDSKFYSVWIRPDPGVPAFEADLGNAKIKWQNGLLSLNEERLPTVSLKTALLMFHAFLKSSPGQFLLVSRGNLQRSLLKLFFGAGLVDQFHGVIAGFSFVFAIWREDPQLMMRHGASMLSDEAREYLRREQSPHVSNTTTHLLLTEEVVTKLLSKAELIEHSQSYVETFTEIMQVPGMAVIYRGLEPLLSVIPEVTLRKLAWAKLSYDVLMEQFQRTGVTGLERFLERQGNIHEILRADDNNIQQSIVNFFQSLNRHHNIRMQ